MGAYRFLAHLAKGNVSFCHHLASVVRRPLSFHILIFSSETAQPNEVKFGRKPKDCSFCRFQRRRFFRNQPIRNKNGLWRPCLLTDQNEMSILHRGPAIDASFYAQHYDSVWGHIDF
jgi:hypothetical protein